MSCALCGACAALVCARVGTVVRWEEGRIGRMIGCLYVLMHVDDGNGIYIHGCRDMLACAVHGVALVA